MFNQYSTKIIATVSKLLLVLGLTCGTSLVNVQSAWAAENLQNFYFENYEVDYYLSQDDEKISHLRVVEQFDAIFPNHKQNHGITRTIPYTNLDGTNLTIKDPNAFSVEITHNGKKEAPYKTEVTDDSIVVYIGDASQYVTGAQTYILEYEFDRVITDFKDYQELYWDTNGDAWSQTFDQVTARVHFEDPAIAQAYTDQAWCYVGRRGVKSSERCTITQLSDGVSFSATGLGSYENLTLDLQFQPNTFAVPPPRKEYTLLWIFIAEASIALILGGLMLFVSSKIREKSRYYQKQFETVQYLPPQNLSVAEAATCYMKNHASSEVATLLELAVSHKVELIKNSGNKDWSVCIKSLDLSPAEITVLQLLKGDDRPLTLEERFSIEEHTSNSTLVRLSRQFSFETVNSAVNKGLLEPTALHDITKTLQRTTKTPLNNSAPVAKKRFNMLEGLCYSFFFFGIIWIFFAGVFGFILLSEAVIHFNRQFMPYLLLPLIIILYLVLLVGSFWFGSRSEKYITRTMKGLEVACYLNGLKTYISMAEQERLTFLQSVNGADITHQGVVKLYERLLPYAALFKLETSWLEEMGKYYEYSDVANPTWYTGADTFSAHEFASAIVSVSRLTSHSVSSAMPTSSSSSSSSGSGGGGFSGGGGGGGGGGGW